MFVNNPFARLYNDVVYDDSIKKEEEKTYYPYTKSFENNDIVDICVNQSDAWFNMSLSSISIKGKVVKTGDGNVSFSPNAAAFLFESVTYLQCGQELETVRDPGRVSAMRGYLCYDQNNTKDLYTASWNYPLSYALQGDNSFHFLLPLRHLFSICSDSNRVTTGKQSIRMVRARDDNECLQITDADTSAEVVIESIELKVMHQVPNDEIKLQLLNAIKKNKPIPIPFMKWELHELPSLKTGATREIWSVKTTSAVESPRFVIVAFQTDRHANLTKDPTYFDHVNITNIRLMLNSDYWPSEQMQLDFSKNDFAVAYKNYANFYRSYAGEKIPLLLDYLSFKTHCLFVIDCSRREDTLKSSTVDVKVEMSASVGFPAKTKCFCLIIHDCVLEHLPLHDQVRSLT